MGLIPDSDELDVTLTMVWGSEQLSRMADGTTVIRTGTTPTTPAEGDSSTIGERDLPQRLTEAPLTSGSGLEDYRMAGILGEGGMGVVHEAQQVNLDRVVALKRLKPDALRRRGRKRMFLAEAVASANLEHPNIVPVYDLALDASGVPFYTMKRIAGEQWSQSIATASLKENLRILQSVCDAVAFAHSRGILHNDLKPSNVMLGDFGEILLVDWGMATALTQGGKAEMLSQESELGGTPAYMAPETATGNAAAIGFHTDVYQLGALLFHVLVGKPPHKRGAVKASLRAAALNEFIDHDVSGELMDVALEAMATDPNDRFESVIAFQGALKTYQEHRESIAIADQALVDYRRGRAENSYHLLARATYAYEEAVALWPGNDRALKGVGKSRRTYAELALERQDLALTRQILEEGDLHDDPLMSDLDRAVRGAQRAERLQRTLLVAVFALLVGVVVVVAWSAHRVGQERDRVEVARVEADNQRVEAERQRQEAEEANLRAQAARQESEGHRLRAEEQADLALQELYRGKIVLAQRALTDGRPVRALEHLEATPKEFRHWEFDYLQGLAEGRLSTLVWSFTPEVGRIKRVALSADGQRVAAAIQDGKTWVLHEYDRENGSLLRSWDGVPPLHGLVEFHGQWALASKSAVVLTHADGVNRIPLEAGVQGMAPMADADMRVLSGGRVFLITGQGTAEPVDWVIDDPIAALSPDGSAVLTQGGRLVVEGQSPIQMASWASRTGTSRVVMSKDRRYIARADSGANGNRIAIHSGRSGELMGFCEGIVGGITDMRFTNDGSRLMAAEGAVKGATSIHTWDVETLRPVDRLPIDRCPSFAVHPDAGLVGVDANGTLSCWNRSHVPEHSLVHRFTSGIRGLSIDPDGAIWVAALTDGVWRQMPGADFEKIAPPDGEIHGLALHPDGTHFTGISRGKTQSHRLTAAPKDRVGKFPGRANGASTQAGTWINDVFVSSIRKNVLAIGIDGMSEHWKRELPNAVRTLRAHPNGSEVWCLDHTGVVHRLSLANGSEVGTPIDPGFAIGAWDMHFSPDGQHLAVVGDDAGGGVVIFDSKTGQTTGRWRDDSTGEFTRVLYHPEGNRLITGSNDHRVDVWDLSNGSHLLSIRAHEALITALEWDAEGRLLSGAWDGRIIRY